MPSLGLARSPFPAPDPLPLPPPARSDAVSLVASRLLHPLDTRFAPVWVYPSMSGTLPSPPSASASHGAGGRDGYALLADRLAAQDASAVENKPTAADKSSTSADKLSTIEREHLAARDRLLFAKSAASKGAPKGVAPLGPLEEFMNE